MQGVRVGPKRDNRIGKCGVVQDLATHRDTKFAAQGVEVVGTDHNLCLLLGRSADQKLGGIRWDT